MENATCELVLKHEMEKKLPSNNNEYMRTRPINAKPLEVSNKIL